MLHALVIVVLGLLALAAFVGLFYLIQRFALPAFIIVMGIAGVPVCIILGSLCYSIALGLGVQLP